MTEHIEAFFADRTLLASLRDSFSYEVYQDLQDYVYEKFHGPTIILMRGPDNTLVPCYPRDRYRGFCTFCRRLRETSSGGQEPSQCVHQEINFVRAGIEAEERGEKWNWGWRECHMHLMDYYIPIRTSQPPDDLGAPLAVLIIGQTRFKENDRLPFIISRLKEITGPELGPQFFPTLSPKERLAIAAELESYANKIPIINEDQRVKMQQGLKEVIDLMGIISTRTLNRAAVFQGEEILHALGLERVAIHIGEDALWIEIQKALKVIIDRLPLKSAIVFTSAHRDHMDIRRRAYVCSVDLNLSDRLVFPSYEEVAWLIKQGGIGVPRQERPLAWLSPALYFGAERAYLFAHETATGHIIILAFGYDKSHPLRAAQRAILYEVTHKKVFHFIESALFGIEMDHLMAETGHLLGRAWGKVVSGYKTLKEIIPLVASEEVDRELVDEAMCTLEEGTQRLELIRQNFYAFRDYRRGQGGLSALEDEYQGQTTEEVERIRERRRSEVVNVGELLIQMRELFDGAVRGSQLKPLQLALPPTAVLVQGPKEILQLVFLNLFDNARKFAYAGTFIRINVTVEDKVCQVEFNNLGIGIAHDELKRVFRPLTRSRFRDPSRRIEGLGLGLSYCKRAIEEDFHGEIMIDSHEAKSPAPRRFEGDNWLTTVMIRIPLTK